MYALLSMALFGSKLRWDSFGSIGIVREDRRYIGSRTSTPTRRRRGRYVGKVRPYAFARRNVRVWGPAPAPRAF